jgi:hypothetical protein
MRERDRDMVIGDGGDQSEEEGNVHPGRHIFANSTNHRLLSSDTTDIHKTARSTTAEDPT